MIGRSQTLDRPAYHHGMARPCHASIYEPGNPHAHACIAGAKHAGADHTCSCGHTWPNPAMSEGRQSMWIGLGVLGIVLVLIVGALVANGVMDSSRHREVCSVYGGPDC